jgi:spermidine synthase
MGRRALRGTVTRQVAGGQAELVPDPDLPHGWVLLVDGTQQSHVDLADPSRLVFEYMRRIGHVIDLLPPGPVHAVHLGGGAMTLARYVSATRPRSRSLVVDSDEALVDMVRRHLPWPREHQIRVRTADARAALDGLPDATADLLVLDVFAGARTPGNLTSIEAFGQARRVLRPGGTLVANIADEDPLAYARRFTAGVSATFAEVAVLAEPAVLRGRRFGNLIVVARPAGAPTLDVTTLARRCAGDPWPGRVIHGEDLAGFIGTHRPYVDSSAPGSPEPPVGFLADE